MARRRSVDLKTGGIYRDAPLAAALSLQQLPVLPRRFRLGLWSKRGTTAVGKPSKPHGKSKPSRSARRRKPLAPPTGESQTGDAATVAWTVAVTTVLLCDIAVVFGHLLARQWPEQRGLTMFRELMQFAATAVGAASLVLLPVVYRVRRVPPPTGFVVFGVCVAVAPMLALVVRSLQ